MYKRGIFIFLFILVLFLVIGCNKEEAPVSLGVSIVVVNETPKLAAADNLNAQDESLEPATQSSSNIKEFSIIAKKFEFVPGTVTVNKGDTVKLNIKSEDVDHGIAIPEFNVKKDVPAGQEATVEFVADKAGTFPFRCSVYCGSGHSEMDGTLIVN
ncbi:cytochrome c oxidase subunit II [Candidatus Woesearchaeota archaeon]|nr:cytochrome c oxidase subunit II [Candidatus Woesearchaeota archaeon]